MPNHFHGWKRKLGVLTLVMACCLVVGWVRSLVVADILWVRVTPWHPEIVSVDSAILPEISYIDFPMRDQLLPRWSTYKAHPIKSLFFDENDIWQVWNGFGVGVRFGVPTQPVSTECGPRTIFCVIPYWSIVLPLTALSAWLLFSKPPGRLKVLGRDGQSSV